MTVERLDTLAGTAFFFGCSGVLAAALTCSTVDVFPPAADAAMALGGIGVILLCVAFNLARRAGYEARRREEQDRRQWKSTP